jgi:hypothetical protein
VRRLTGTSEDLQEMMYPSAPAPAPVNPSTLQSILAAFSGFYEGLFLITKYPYVMHIMGVTCLYEIVLTVMDYEFKLLGADSTTTEADSGAVLDGSEGDTNEFANLLGHFGYVCIRMTCRHAYSSCVCVAKASDECGESARLIRRVLLPSASPGRAIHTHDISHAALPGSHHH